MFDGFFTFRYFDMIRQPYINNEWNNYPEHRTSLWSQLYGRTVFMHFDQWPMGWQTKAPAIVNIGRVLIVFGIVPLLLFCTGIGRNIYSLGKALITMDKNYLSAPGNYIYLLITLAFLSSSVFYTYQYRDFSSMKSIYIFPGLLAFVKMFIDGYSWARFKNIIPVINVILVVIIVFSLADILFLAHQLYVSA